MSDTAVKLVVGLLAMVVLIAAAERVLRGQERRLAERYGADFAGARTRVRLLRRVVLGAAVIVGAIAILGSTSWGRPLASALLASSAVIALITGFALRTPLANLAAGVQLALTQPFRLGDRIRVGDSTGVVEEIKLSYTVLRTDDGRRAYLPNEQLIATPIVNATIEDPKRSETVTVPVSLDADLDAVHAALLAVVEAMPDRVDSPAPTVRYSAVSATSLTASITAGVADGRAAAEIASSLRAAAVTRLRTDGALGRE